MSRPRCSERSPELNRLSSVRCDLRRDIQRLQAAAHAAFVLRRDQFAHFRFELRVVPAVLRLRLRFGRREQLGDLRVEVERRLPRATIRALRAESICRTSRSCSARPAAELRGADAGAGADAATDSGGASLSRVIPPWPIWS